jgi:hypothetical protein
MRVLLIALLLSGCAAWEALEAHHATVSPPPPGYTRVFWCPAPELGICGPENMKQVGPSSQGSFQEPLRH